MAHPWPADTVERRALSTLAPYIKNARMHSEAQIAQLAESIREFGFTIPILVDEGGNLIAGHGRVLAAQALGLDDVPCMTARGWTERQIKAYRIADNKLALNADWDIGLLAAELEELPGLESLIGFSEDELLALFKGEEPAAVVTPEEARRKLSERFGIPPFSVMNAREGWWQDRKRAWISLGIQSEVGRGEQSGPANATVTGSPMPATNYKDSHARGDGRGRPMVVAGNGWANGGPARRDAAFYAKKRAWEKANDTKISTTEFREKHWGGE